MNVLSNCPTSPCYCKKKQTGGPTVSTTSGGWYVVIREVTYISGPPGTGIQMVPGAYSWVGDGGATTGDTTPNDPIPATFTVWLAFERNVLFDNNPYYSGYGLGEFISYADAYSAAAQALAFSKPIQTEPIVVQVGPGTGHPTGT